ncbi:acetyltransferase [bacterium SCGC AG-212-C10]|nr:acetyltransferase [bacterium SCGC AG-212-C10]
MLLPTLRTERLEIRQFVPRDWRDVHAYTSSAEVMTYIPGGAHTEARAQEFAAENSGEEAEAFAVVHSASQQLFGHIIFHPWYAEHTYEIGWVFHPAYYRQGFATEAAAALRDYGFAEMKLHRLIATCQPENEPSWRIMKRLGMRREAWFRGGLLQPDGRWWDEYFYAMLDDEWAAQTVQR